MRWISVRFYEMGERKKPYKKCSPINNIHSNVFNSSKIKIKIENNETMYTKQFYIGPDYVNIPYSEYIADVHGFPVRNIETAGSLNT